MSIEEDDAKAQAAQDALDAKELKERLMRTTEWLSDDLQATLHDNFERYDLNQSGTVDTSLELTKMATNLVVKLEMSVNVDRIAEMVKAVGPFQNDEGQPEGAENLNVWDEKTFQTWFCNTFQVNTSWRDGDEEEDEDEFEASRPFLQGAWSGELGGGSKVYEAPVMKDVQVQNGKITTFQVDHVPEFSLWIRFEEGSNMLMQREGWDVIGEYQMTGVCEGNQLTVTIDYVNGPCLVLQGATKGAEAPLEIKGTWVNTRATSDALKWYGLGGVASGAFDLKKKVEE